MMRIAAVALGFVLLYGIGAVLGWVVLPIVRLVAWERVSGQHRCQRIVARALGILVWYISAVGVYVTGTFAMNGKREDADVAPGSVVIANHPSLLDVVLLKSAIGHGVIIVKPIYYFHPLLGPLAWCCGYIRGGAGLARGMQVIRDAVDRIADGSTVILFPEGTRSPSDEALGAFHRGAFRIAEEANAPLAPFWVECRPRVLGKAQGLRGYPKTGKVHLDAFKLWDDESEIVVTNARSAASDWEQRYNSILADGGMKRCT